MPICELDRLREEHERSLILAALGAVGGRQKSAAALLRMPARALREAMSRLGVRPQRPARRHDSAGGPRGVASFHWACRIGSGSLVELRGLNGPLRIEAGDGERLEVVALLSGPRALLGAVEVRRVEHELGVAVCTVCRGFDPSAPRRLERRLSRGLASVRSAIVARVPPGARVLATSFNDDVEVVGLRDAVDAWAANGSVRFLPADTPPATAGQPAPRPAA